MAEVEAVCHLLESTLQTRLQDTVVLAFYKSQMETIRKELARRNLAVPVATVDSFQGRESPIVLLSLVLSEPTGSKFIRDKSRALVALTRVQETLYLVGKKAYWERNSPVALIKDFAKAAILAE